MHIQYFITLMNKHIQQFITSNTGMFLFNYNLTCFFKTILIYDLSFLVLIMCKIYGAENNFMIVGSNDPHISYIRSVLRNVCGEHVVCIWYECSLCQALSNSINVDHPVTSDHPLRARCFTNTFCFMLYIAYACTNGSYRCQSGECIPISQYCDEVVHCNSSDDEPGRCSEYFYLCCWLLK